MEEIDIDLIVLLEGIKRGVAKVGHIKKDDPYRIEKLEAKRVYYKEQLKHKKLNPQVACIKEIDKIDKQLKEARGKDV